MASERYPDLEGEELESKIAEALADIADLDEEAEEVFYQGRQ